MLSNLYPLACVAARHELRHHDVCAGAQLQDAHDLAVVTLKVYLTGRWCFGVLVDSVPN